MRHVGDYRLLWGLNAPIQPRPPSRPLPAPVAFARNVLITCALAVIIAFACRQDLSRFLVQPLLDALKEALERRTSIPSYPFHYPTPLTLLVAALPFAAPIIAIQIWTLFARRAFGPETLRVAWWRAVLTIGGFVVGAALGHYLTFPLVWPLLLPFDLRAAPSHLGEFAGLHVGTMLLGGLAAQVPALVTLLKGRRVRV